MDTLRVITYDSTTVVSRAKDTVRLIEEHVGPLTEQRLARLICPDQTYGDDRDVFGYNTLGMIVCPKNGLTK